MHQGGDGELAGKCRAGQALGREAARSPSGRDEGQRLLPAAGYRPAGAGGQAVGSSGPCQGGRAGGRTKPPVPAGRPARPRSARSSLQMDAWVESKPLQEQAGRLPKGVSAGENMPQGIGARDLTAACFSHPMARGQASRFC